MAQYYTLDEASRKLGVTIDEFRKGIATKWKNLRRFPDGPTLRFQAREIDELARTLGRMSEAMPQPPLDEPLPLADKPSSSSLLKKKAAEETAAVPPSSDEFIPLADDHVMLPAKAEKTGSDSDVKLESSGKLRARAPSTDDPTEVLEIVDEGSKKTKRAFDIKAEAPKKTPPRPHKAASEFDMNLGGDSDDFDLELTDDSEDIPIGTVTKKGPRSGDSGINLQDPADSGISLEKDSSDFELQMEQPKTPSRIEKDSDSEFELTLDEPGGEAAVADDQKDIFETDFELPAIDDSGSEDRPSGTDLDESDFDLSVEDEGGEEESASEVVAIEEEEEGDELREVDEEEAESKAVRVVESAPADWGALPAAVLIPTVMVMFFVGLMGYELLRSMWGYQAGAPVSGSIVRTIGGMFGKFED